MYVQNGLPAYSSAKIIKNKRIFLWLWSQMCCHVFNESQCILCSKNEIFISSSWYSILPSLDATISFRIKKVNRDEGGYQLSHAYNRFMRQLIVASRLGRTEYQLLLTKISRWDRNIKIRYKMFGCDLWIIGCIDIPTKWIYFLKVSYTQLHQMLTHFTILS